MLTTIRSPFLRSCALLALLALAPLLAQKIAFVSNRSGNLEVYAVNFDGSGLINTTNDPAADDSPQWSPDGTRILFRSDRSGAPQPYVMNSDGTALTRLAVEGDLCGARWSTDGAKILLSTTTATVPEAGKAYRANADGSELTQVASVGGCPEWSPNGTKLLYTPGDYYQGNLFVFDTVGQSLAWSSPGLGDFALGRQWSPDGSRILVPSDTGPGVVNGLKLIVFDAASGSSTVISHGGPGTLSSAGMPWASDEYVKWSPDGGKILVQSRGGDSFSDIPYAYVMNSDGSGRVNLTTSQAALQHPEYEQAFWSSDGSKLLFESGRSGTREVYVANADGSGLVKLSDSQWPEGDSVVGWSPDGSRIFFGSSGGGHFALNVVKPDGSGLEDITNRFGPGYDLQFFGDFSADPTPSITQSGVVMANLVPTVGAISPLSIISVFGSGFSAGSVFYPALDQDGRLDTILGGTCVEIGGERVPIFAMTPGQANVQAPGNPSYGPTSVVVVRNCGRADEVRSQPETVMAEEATPVFWVDGYDPEGYIRARFNDGFAPVAPTDSLSDPKGPSRPAKRGEIILLFGTGWGSTTARLEAGQLAKAAAPLLASANPMVTFGDIPLAAENILYVGSTPEAAGLYQLAIRVPATALPGPNQVVLNVYGKSTPVGPTVPVAAP